MGELSSVATIVCCLDQRYVLALCVLLESLSRSNSDVVRDLRMVVLHESLTDDAVDRIAAQGRRLGVNLEIIQVDPLDDRYPSTTDGPHGDQLTRSIYLRLMIDNVLPTTRRALYLDSDVLVLKDIRPLLEEPMRGIALGAVRDPIQPTLEEGYALPGWREEGVPGNREYFNSGVLALNLDECREQGLFDRARRFLVDHPERAVCLDQDALNWAAGDRWLRLDPRWNTFTAQSYATSTTGPERLAKLAEQEVLDSERNSAILHYAGPRKPWLDSSADIGSAPYVLYRRLRDDVLASEAGEVAEGVR